MAGAQALEGKLVKGWCVGILQRAEG